MKFLVDSQLPATLARFLASRGAECKHVVDFDLADATDGEIWEYAGRNDYAVISKDEDFLYLASEPSAKARFIWVRLGIAAPRRFSPHWSVYGRRLRPN